MTSESGTAAFTAATGFTAFTVERVVVREHVAFRPSASVLGVGRDGRAYLVGYQSTGQANVNYILATTIDGRDRRGLAYQQGNEIPCSVTANDAAHGRYLARAEAHFAGAVSVLGPDLDPQPVGRWVGAYFGDDVGWDAPYRVEAGEVSGRFYALAQYGLFPPPGSRPGTPPDRRPTVVVIGSPPEPVTRLASHPLPFAPEKVTVLDFRLREGGTAGDPQPLFYVLYTNKERNTRHLAKIDASGRVLWDRTDPVIQKLRGDYYKPGGFDVDQAGYLYVVEPEGAVVHRYPDDGTGAAVPLRLPADRPSPVGAPYRALRVWGRQILLQRAHDRELYSVLTLPDPSTSDTDVVFGQSVHADHDVVRAEFGDEPAVRGAPWTAGRTVTARLTIDRYGRGTQQRVPAPRWRAWLRSPGGQDHRELTVTPDPGDDTLFRIAVPADATGLSQLTLSPDTGPSRSGDEMDYRLHRFVEIRPESATGSVTLSTVSRAVVGTSSNNPTDHPLNRTRYARGEPVVVTVSVRQKPATIEQITLRLDDVSGSAPVTVARTTLPVSAEPVTITVPAALTEVLRPGRYLLTAEAPGLTIAPQPLEFGPAQPVSAYRRVWFEDLARIVPTTADLWNAADTVAAHLERVRRQGWTITVERLGSNLNRFLVLPLEWDTAVLGPLRARLLADPVAVDPMKLWRLPSTLDVIAGLGALGVRERGVLVINDATLPLPEEIDPRGNEDSRTPILRYFDLFQANGVCSAYPAFQGWHWAANWLRLEVSVDQLNKYAKPRARELYSRELVATRTDGTWRPLVAAMFTHALEHAPAAQRLLREVLDAGADAGAGSAELITSVAGPFRFAFVYPPETFVEVDEVDLQAQWEQFPLMLHTAFAVDYYVRPGRPSTLHEDNWNDSGTGDQLLSQAFAALMRGGDTSGHSAPVPIFRQQSLVPDPRNTAGGWPSMVRVLAGVLHEYGEWISRFRGADQVAILVSRRQFAVETWFAAMPEHFGRIFEAYLGLLYAHLPASIVFVEDLGTPGVRPLTDYAAVVLVHERIAFDTDVLTALREAARAGVRVFHDGECRDSVVAEVGSAPLRSPTNLTFDRSFVFDAVDPAAALFPQAGNDASYHSSNPNPVLRSWYQICLDHGRDLRSALGDVVSGPRATADDPQVLVSERTLGEARIVVALNNSMFDVDNAIFRRAENFSAVRAPLTCRLRLPAASGVVYDVLAGARVSPAEDGTVTADFRHWPVAIYALLPAPVLGPVVTATTRADGPNGTSRVHWSVRMRGADPDLPLPVRVRIRGEATTVLWETHTTAPAEGILPAPVNAGTRLWVTAVDLLSGQTDTTDVAVVVPSEPMDLLTGPEALVADRSTSTALPPQENWEPATQRLGAHVNGIALTGDTAVLTTSNWDSNLYALDLTTGAQRWQTRIGQQYTFSPRTISGGVAVHGMALDTHNGYGLHLVRAESGTVERRFDLHGTAPRWFHRISSNRSDGLPPAFATPPSGAWVVTAGNLGLAAWRRDGTPLWHQDWWQEPLSQRPGAASEAHLTAVDEDTVLLVARQKAVTYQVSTGAERWSRDLAPLVTTIGGKATSAARSPDGRLLAVATTYDTGRLFLLDRAHGTLVATLPATADELAWSPDSRTLITLQGTRVILFRATAGVWSQHSSYPAADVLHHLDVAEDGRIACGDEQGNLVVLNPEAEPLLVTDVVGLPVPTWLPGGDLLVGTWLGLVSRIDGVTYQRRWTTLLRSTAATMRENLLAPETAPVTAVTGSGNAIPPVTAPNLLNDPAHTVVQFVGWDEKRPVALRADQLLATTPNPTPPAMPLLSDPMIEFTAESFALCYLHIRPPEAVTFDALTLWDDPAHPESWLRHLRLDVRRTPDDVWRPITHLVAGTASRSYRITDPAQPVSASALRLVVPPGLAGNLRLAGIALHRLGTTR
ncbi:Outer membrane protein assembly factor BamB, contains PQQ-like beta-propeller repeat [Streptoalloteichus tenebrarius]|uniref:Outer membrane protein assembly factor BamB, contains PQQ-like beta-propeller repeat n=1 Tax=Streptoalloteichus tenebrarius (strain ATCC 17920 / DSM 40477 / JCM 4838 / CBS 697.72 / NBRC 16177 / NCIMB 11028 / NRRL B-12390 / A12253. 1 / ISP 5477) TaxID=1933 RepID=A0ABT1HUU4_STRSD|nr:PQQ-binding-like beta-propeller repeat protein [Streptoalloteichus tenebrarius]MCP2259294.1 Outer membrane protein assembly factor BamB, contains PQQ-like beta-propeller repeat [Streptoalloteichus tenebrarius]BFE99055.1 hypothetical protein GCM10020241_07310 [Streptoalloteichus tenebrarius]